MRTWISEHLESPERTLRAAKPPCAPSLRRCKSLAVAVLFVVGSPVVGCGDDDDGGSGAPPPAKATKKAVAKAGGPGKAPTGAAGKAAAGRKVWTDAELEAIADYEVRPEDPMPEEFFEEDPENRDPFRPQVEIRSEGPKEASTEDCVLAAYPLDELRLIGIISGIPAPRALFVDPAGTDWKVRRGDCIGKAGGRVDRVTSSEVIITEVSRITGEELERIIALHAGRLDVGAALKSGDPAALAGPLPKPGAAAEVAGLGVVPGAALAAPPLTVGLSEASFVAYYGRCYARKPSLKMVISGPGEVWARVSSAGECADLPGALVVVNAGRVTSIQAF